MIYLKPIYGYDFGTFRLSLPSTEVRQRVEESLDKQLIQELSVAIFIPKEPAGYTISTL